MRSAGLQELWYVQCSSGLIAWVEFAAGNQLNTER